MEKEYDDPVFYGQSKALLNTKFPPEHIVSDYQNGGTRIVISSDSVLPQGEQECIRDCLTKILYDAIQKQRSSEPKGEGEENYAEDKPIEKR